MAHRYPLLLFMYYVAGAMLLLSTSCVQAMCPNGCSGRGVCDRYMVCHCLEGYTGYDCSGTACPRGKAWGVVTGNDRAHELEMCSGRGYCSLDTGVCQCQQGFHGNACQFADCPDSCMAHGNCVSMREHAQNELLSRELYDAFNFRYDGVWDADMILGCECDDTYSSANCALKKCPLGDDPLTSSQLNEVQLTECLTSYQQQTLTLRSDAALTQGTFILFFGKQYTRPISYNALATLDSNGMSIASSLLALKGVDAITVTKTDTPPSRVDWQINYPMTNSAQSAVVPRWKVLEVQQFICAADAGVFSLTFGNQTISKIPFNADVNTFLSFVLKIQFIGSLDVALSPGATTICSATGTYVTIKFTQLWDRNYFGDIPAMTFSNLDAKGLVTLFLNNGGDGFIDVETKEVTKGIDTCRVIEQQSFVCAATSGNFALTFEDGSRITGIPFDTSASFLRTTIIASVPYIIDIDVFYSDGSTTACTVTGTTVTINFVVVKSTGAKGDGDLAEVLADCTNNGVGGLNHISNRLKFPTTALTEVVRGVTCVPLDQSFSADPTNQIVAPVQQGGGTFTVSFRDYTSIPIPAHSPPEGVQRIIQLMPSIQGVNVSYSGAQACETPANVMSITFTQNFGNFTRVMNSLTTSSNSLSMGGGECSLPTVVVDGTLLVTGSNIAAFGGGNSTQNIVSVDGTKESAVCSGRGQCDDLKLGKCVCFLGYTSSNGNGELGSMFVNRGDCGCTSRTPVSCPGEFACSGHGTCSGDPSWKCSCAVGWQGGDCADRTCPSGTSWFDYPVDMNVAHRTMSECSGVGSCDRSSGLCKCPRPYTGTACELMSCGGTISECSGNGQCLTLNTLAPLVTVKGDAAGFSYGDDPNNPTTWDRHKIRSCLCDSMYFGYDCSLRECPRGDDPSTYDDVVERQLVQCIAASGSFALTFRDQTTAPIPFNANEITIKSALESLSTLQEVRVTFSGSAGACSTGNSVIMIDLLSELGDLPSLRGSQALLRDSVNGNGQDGSGTLIFASGGATLQGQASVKGTREFAFCSNHGVCDFGTGICKCNDNYGSSDGKGGRGPIGDCGFHELKYVGQQQQSSFKLKTQSSRFDRREKLSHNPSCRVHIKSPAHQHQHLPVSMSDEERVDVDRILRNPAESFTATYNQRDLILYAAGIGESDLQFTYEYSDKFAAFPLYPVVLGFKGESHDVVPFPPPTLSATPDGMPVVNPAMILHGEQSLELLRPLNPEGGELQCETRVVSFFNKGKGTLMESETLMKDADGPVARLISGSFVRGLTGFEGKGRKLPPRVQIPKREPDARETFKTAPTQAQLYRLSGDYNSLHIDPEIAKSVGFPAPILHGLCTMGVASRALYKRYCRGDPANFKSIRVRFASPCFPGETLETVMWENGNTVYFQTIVKERNVVVIDGGEFVHAGPSSAKL